MPDSDSTTGPAATLETASWGRRLLALILDFGACWGILLLVKGPEWWFGSGSGDDVVGGSPFAGPALTLLFVLESTLFVAMLGGSFGQVLTRLRVVRVIGGPVPLLMSLLRAVLVALVIPPLVFKADGRGLHDLIAKTQVVRLA